MSETEPERTMRVFVTNQIRCSDGAFIGWHEVPIAEANALIANRRATAVDPGEALAAEMRRSENLMQPRRPVR
jgi:hypothetical protein